MLRRPGINRLDRRVSSRAARASRPTVSGEDIRRSLEERLDGAAGRRGRGRVATATPSDVPDVLAPGLDVVFCGINPGRVSAAAHAHFANPRNDFWRLLHAARLHAAAVRPARAVRAARSKASASRTPRTARRPARATSGARDFAGSASGSSGSRASSSRAGSRSSARRHTAACSTSGPSSACRSGRSATRSSSCCRRRRRRTPPCRGPSGCAGSASSRAALGHAAAAGRPRARPRRDRPRCCSSASSDAYGELVGDARRRRRRRERATSRRSRRELARGVRPATSFELGPLLWTREHWLVDPRRFGGQRERVYLVRDRRVRALAPHARPRRRGRHEARWFTLDELAARATVARAGSPRSARDLSTTARRPSRSTSAI